jgi:hypothetical protein
MFEKNKEKGWTEIKQETSYIGRDVGNIVRQQSYEEETTKNELFQIVQIQCSASKYFTSWARSRNHKTDHILLWT